MEFEPIRTEGDQEELYGLLSLAEVRFAEAIQATASYFTPLDSTGAIAGRAIFENTLDAVLAFKWDGRTPIFGEHPGNPSDVVILPTPVLAALVYCFGCDQAVCLHHLNLSCGDRRLDNSIISWPFTILRSLDARSRFFRDMIHVYEEQYPGDIAPILSDPQTRALQLLVIGKAYLKAQKEKVGLPAKFHIVLPE